MVEADGARGCASLRQPRLASTTAGVECPQVLLTWASCDVEVSEAIAVRRGIRSLEAGATVLAAGQLSERWAVSGGRARRRAAIVAALVHPEPPPDLDEPLIPEGPPAGGRKSKLFVPGWCR